MIVSNFLHFSGWTITIHIITMLFDSIHSCIHAKRGVLAWIGLDWIWYWQKRESCSFVLLRKSTHVFLMTSQTAEMKAVSTFHFMIVRTFGMIL